MMLFRTHMSVICSASMLTSLRAESHRRGPFEALLLSVTPNGNLGKRAPTAT